MVDVFDEIQQEIVSIKKAVLKLEKENIKLRKVIEELYKQNIKYARNTERTEHINTNSSDNN